MIDIVSKRWKEFFISDIGEIESGIDIYESERTIGDIPYISAKSKDNGIGHFIGNSNATLESNCISVNRNGSVGYAFYHPYKALYSNDCRKIRLNKNLNKNKHISLFIINQIAFQKDKYSYGYKMGTVRLKRQKIMLPVDENDNPDWNLMEAYIKEKEQSFLAEYKKYLKNRLKHRKKKFEEDLLSKEWGEFKIDDIFPDIKRGKRLKNEDHINGNMPYVSSSGTNNGVDDYLSNEDNVRIFSNCLTLANSGTVGSCFYQPFEFVASDHVTKLSNDHFNKYIYLFIGAISMRLSEKYSFNREIADKRLKKEKIMLPVDDDGNPDWDFMESYMENLEYEKISEYLNYIENRDAC